MPRHPLTVDWRLRERRSRRRRGGWQTSGGVVVDVESGRVLLVKNRRERREGGSGWTWPKGVIDPGEGPLYAAIREIREEAGVVAEPLCRIATLETRRALRHYFLLSLIQHKKPRGHETLKVRWVTFAEASKLLQRKRDRHVLRAAEDALQSLGSWQAA